MGAPARTFASRSGAVRAARAECRRHIGPVFCAFEGPDYEIHPDGASMWDAPRFYFRLRGPALAISEGATPEEAGII